MAKVIICIHGLGNKPPEELLKKWWRRSIIDGLRGIGEYILSPKIEMIYWADLLNSHPLDPDIRDKSHPLFLNDIYTHSPKKIVIEKHEVRKKVLSFVEKQMDKLFLNKDQTINYSFISDFIIHKYFKDLETYYKAETINGKNTLAKDLIRQRLVDVLNRHKKDDIFLIAHSMGTIIAYDVLILNLSEATINTFVTMGSPLGIPIVISKIATELKEKFHHSKKLSTPDSVTNFWYNFSDLEDKVAMNYNLADDYEPNIHGIKAIDFEVSNNYQVNGEKNPHKSYGYLRAPEFSKILCQFLLKDRAKLTLWFLSTMNNIYKWSINTTINLLKRFYKLQTGIPYES